VPRRVPRYQNAFAVDSYVLHPVGNLRVSPVGSLYLSYAYEYPVAAPFIPICADPATVGVCAETVASVDLAKNSISAEYGLRRARHAGVYGYFYGYLDRPQNSAAEALDLDHIGRRSTGSVYGCCCSAKHPELLAVWTRHGCGFRWYEKWEPVYSMNWHNS
jgi:hypothetical protein